MELDWEEVQKAHRNVRQIYLYLAAAGADAPADSAMRSPLEQIEALARSIAGHLARLAEANAIQAGTAPLPGEEPRPARLDASKLRTISGYLGKVLSWITSKDGARVAARCQESFVELLAMVEFIATIASSACAGTPPAEEPSGHADQAPAVSQLLSDAPPAIDAPDVPPLTLEHTFQEPLLRGMEGKFELTQRAVTMLDDYFKECELEFDNGERRRLYRKIVRWLEATPEGMVLTLRIGGLSGRLEPYPRYQPRQDNPPR